MNNDKKHKKMESDFGNLGDMTKGKFLVHSISVSG